MGASGLGSLLVKEGYLTEQDRVIITKSSGANSWAFAKGILAAGLLEEEELVALLAERTKIRVASKNLIAEAEEEALQAIDLDLMLKLEVLPLRLSDNCLTVAMADPLDQGMIRQLEFFTSLKISPALATLSDIYAGLKSIEPDFEPQKSELESFLVNHALAAVHQQKLKKIIDSDDGGSRAGRSSAKKEKGIEITELTDDEGEQAAGSAIGKKTGKVDDEGDILGDGKIISDDELADDLSACDEGNLKPKAADKKKSAQELDDFSDAVPSEDADGLDEIKSDADLAEDFSEPGMASDNQNQKDAELSVQGESAGESEIPEGELDGSSAGEDNFEVESLDGEAFVKGESDASVENELVAGSVGVEGGSGADGSVDILDDTSNEIDRAESPSSEADGSLDMLEEAPK
ncbi:MAG: hypothetical protein HQK54_02080, partial [Oligoflexales bacterium]|nr:hypothetical protein [Oligoflexales bacterium]